ASSTRAAARKAGRRTAPLLDGVDVVFDLSNEPTLAYSLSIVADGGASPATWTSTRLKTSTLILETATQRFELCRDGVGASGFDTYRLARVPCADTLGVSAMRWRGLPLPREDVETIGWGMDWSQLCWREDGLRVLPPDPAKTASSCKQDREGGTHVRGLTRLPVTSSEEALSALFEGGLNRAVAEHALNAASTRSHCVFTLYLERQYAVRGKDGSVASTETVRSKLHLVDLAGSERQSKTGSEGGVQVQASYINKSLSFLEQVVLALLSRQREHVPYRSSKLTNMLKDSLGGNCRTRMIACVWPDARHVEESVATLRFATRMMKVKTRVSKNVSREGGGSGSVSRATIAKYEGEIKALKRELAMHDALVGRTGVRYGPLTDAETDLIQDLVEAY
ncbi:Kif9, partial [Symbiodinium sp. KB8]